MTELGKMDCHGLTERGASRSVNEDQFVVAHLNKSMLVSHASSLLHDRTRLFGGTEGHLFLVAGGRGAGESGKDASAIAVDSVMHYVLNTMPWFFQLDVEKEDLLLDELRAALHRSQDAVLQLAGGTPERRHMSTTLTMGYLLWPRLFVVHLGDSRCYLLRESKLQRITVDHTEAHLMVDGGRIATGDTPTLRLGDVLWNAIGGGAEGLFVDAYLATLHVGDALLLCTDGLTRHVADDRIHGCLASCATAEAACHALVEAANHASGKDNVTVVVAYFRRSGGEMPAAEAAAAEAPEEQAKEQAPSGAGAG
jgi:protein phosphatase